MTRALVLVAWVAFASTSASVAPPRTVAVAPPRIVAFAPPRTVAFAPARTLAFAPVNGTKLERSLAIEHHLVLEGLTLVQGTTRRTVPAELVLDSKETLAATDELRRVEGGRPTLVKRRYGAGAYHADRTSGGAKTAYDAQHVLENAGVVFTWVPEEKDWGRYYDEREEEEGLLARLGEDLDALALLPKSPVDVGSTWTVPASDLTSVLAPGGELALRWPKDADPADVRSLTSGIGGGLTAVFGGAADGEAKLTLAGVDATADGEVARVAIELDVRFERDQQYETPASAGEDASSGPSGRAHVRWSLRGKGEMLWSLASSRLARLELSGSQRVVARIALADPSVPEQELELAGTLSIVLGASAAK